MQMSRTHVFDWRIENGRIVVHVLDVDDHFSGDRVDAVAALDGEGQAVVRLEVERPPQ